MDHYHSARYCCWRVASLVRLNAFVLVFALGAYCISRFVIPPAATPPIFRSHFHDFLATPVLLAASNLWIAACRCYDLLLLRFHHILALSLVAGCFWEFVTPLYHRSTTDGRDLIAYAVGSVAYFIALCVFQQWPNNARTPRIAPSDGNQTESNPIKPNQTNPDKT